MAVDEKAPLTASRGVRLWLFACVPIAVAVIFALVAVFVLILQGRIAIEAGIALMFGGILTGGFAVVPLAGRVVDGWTRQDVAKIEASAPKTPATQVAIGEHANASTTHETPPVLRE